MGCAGESGDSNKVVDKKTFIMKMEKNMYDLEQMNLATDLLATEMSLIKMFTGDASKYKESVEEYKKELERIGLEAKNMPVPKDSASKEIYSIYLEIVTERTQILQPLLDSILTMDLGKLFGVSTTVALNYDKRWDNFKSLWITYKSN